MCEDTLFWIYFYPWTLKSKHLKTVKKCRSVRRIWLLDNLDLELGILCRYVFLKNVCCPLDVVWLYLFLPHISFLFPRYQYGVTYCFSMLNNKPNIFFYLVQPNLSFPWFTISNNTEIIKKKRKVRDVYFRNYILVTITDLKQISQFNISLTLSEGVVIFVSK